MTIRSTLLCTGALALVTAAAAVGTPANTVITNTASLNFRNSLGADKQIDSNAVKVTVRQVYAATVSPDAPATAIPQARTFGAAADQVRFVPYTLRNDGNGSDTLDLSVVQAGSGDDFDLSSVLVYADRDNNGAPDAPTALTQLTLPADATVHVLVAARTPAGTPAGAVAKFALRAASVGDPAVTDEDNYAQVTVTPDAQLALTLRATPEGAVQPGSTIRYVAGGTNASAAAAGNVQGAVTVDGVARDGLFVQAALPAGMTLLEVNAASGSSAGSSVPLYSPDGGQTWTATRPAAPVTAVGLLIRGSGPFFGSGATFTLDFGAAVPAASPAGSDLSAQATVNFDGNTDGDGADSGETVTSLATGNVTARVSSAAFGPFAAPGGAGAGSYLFGGRSINRAGDLQSFGGSVPAGTSVAFKQTLRNTGNVTNTFSVSVEEAPAGWSCRILEVDAADTLGAFANPVTLAAGASIDLASECAVPLDAVNAAAQEVRLAATPDGGTPDFTLNRVAQITAAGPVVLGNSDGNPATAPDPAPLTVSAAPGTPARFRLELHNGAAAAERYTLGAQLPAGYGAAVFRLDSDCDGTPEGTALTQTPEVPAGGTLCLTAEVTPPAGQAAGSDALQFTATSVAVPGRRSTLTDVIQVEGLANLSAGPDGALATAAGGQVVYTHTLTNLSNSAVTVTLPAFASAKGWTYEYSTDGVAFVSRLEGPDALQLGIGERSPLYVRVSVPATYQPSAGDREVAVLRVTATTATTPGASSTVALTDTTSALRSSATITKRASLCAEPGCTTTTPLADGALVAPRDVVLYTITATNDGDTAQTSVYVADQLPAATAFVSAAATGSGLTLLYSVDQGETWTASAPAGLPDGVLWVGVDSDDNGTVDAADTFTAGQSFTVRFVVRIQ